MLASAIALATLVTTTIPVVQAQGDQPPAATPIPLLENVPAAPKAEPITEPTAAVEPQATDAIIWTPDSGALTINNLGQTSVRVATTSGTLDPNTARYVLIVNGVPQADQNIVGQPVGNNATLDLNVSGLGSVNTSNTRILFKVNLSGGAQQESAIYNLTRNSRLSLPVINRDSGVSTIPLNITQTAASSCDASNSRRGGPLGSFLRYTVSNTAMDSWFWAFNPNPGASIVVSLTNYSAVQGQLQVVVDSAGGCGTNTMLGFGTNPNPVVAVNNVPRGNIFFRVVSGSGQPQPPAYNIGWGFNRGGGGGGSGTEIEPNNNTCQPTPLPVGATFTANDNDQFDFYSITITTSGQIMILMEGHQTVGTQVQVRAPVGFNGVGESNCQSTIPAALRKDPYTDPVGNVGSPGAQVLTRSGLVFPGGNNGEIAGSPNPPQTWFIRVALPANTSPSNKQYTIRWAYLPPGSSALPFPDKLGQTAPANGPDPLLRANSPFSDNTRELWYYSYFWANLDKLASGVDTIQMGLDSWTLDGCPASTFPPDPSRTVPTGFAGNWVTVSNQPSGVMTWKMNKSGAYRVRFRALRNNNVVAANEKPIRVDCGFTTYNFGGLWPLSNETTTPGSPLIGPEKPADWVEPIP